MKEMYVAEFHACKKTKTEGWVEFANHLKLFIDKDFPDLEGKAREYHVYSNRIQAKKNNYDFNFCVIFW